MSRMNDEKRYKSKSKPADRSGHGGEAWSSFIAVNMTKEQKELYNRDIARWEQNPVEDLCNIIEAGHKLAIRWNRRLGCYQVTMTGLEDSEFNEGWTISTYHVDSTRALGLMSFALHEVYTPDKSWAAVRPQLAIDW